MRSQLKHQTYLAMAQQLSGLSTCLRLHVGCVLLRLDGSVAGVGYNGALPHKPHCTPETCNPSVRCYRTRHAERSALDYSTGDIAIAYTTHEPCLRCTQDLIARGCLEVYYLTPYLAKDPAENAARTMHVRESGMRWTWANPDGSARAWYIDPAKATTEQRKAVRQEARRCLPNETEAPILVTGNLRAWRHMIEQRASRFADAEICSVAYLCFQKLREHEPMLWSDYTVETVREDGLSTVQTQYRKV